MPTYAYTCRSCGHSLEAKQSFSDPALTECPDCSGPLRKVFSSVGVVFKGSGFYRNDSRTGAKGSAADAGGSGPASEGAGSSGSGSDGAGSSGAGSSGAGSSGAGSDGGGSAAPSTAGDGASKGSPTTPSKPGTSAPAKAPAPSTSGGGAGGGSGARR